jgi:hypothetical protein
MNTIVRTAVFDRQQSDIAGARELALQLKPD